MHSPPASPTPRRTRAQSHTISFTIARHLKLSPGIPYGLRKFYENEERERRHLFPPEKQQPAFRNRYALFDLPKGDNSLGAYFDGRMKCVFDDEPTQTRPKIFLLTSKPRQARQVAHRHVLKNAEWPSRERNVENHGEHRNYVPRENGRHPDSVPPEHAAPAAIMSHLVGIDLGTGPFRPNPFAKGTRVEVREGKQQLVISRTDLCEHVANVLRARCLPVKPIPFGPPYFKPGPIARFCHIGIAEHNVPLERVLIDLVHDCRISSIALLTGAVIVDTLAASPGSPYEKLLDTYSINCFVASCVFIAHKLIDDDMLAAHFKTGERMTAVFRELCHPAQRTGLEPSFFARQEWHIAGMEKRRPLIDIRADYSQVFEVFLWQAKGGTLAGIRDGLLKGAPPSVSSPSSVESVKFVAPKPRYWVEQIPHGMTAEQYLASQRGDPLPATSMSMSVNMISSASLASFAASSSSSSSSSTRAMSTSPPPSSLFPMLSASDYAIPLAQTSASTSSASSASSSSVQVHVTIDLTQGIPRRRRIHKKGQTSQRVDTSPLPPRPKPVVVTKRMKPAPLPPPPPPPPPKPAPIQASCVIDLTLLDDSDDDSDVEVIEERKAPVKTRVVVTRAQKQANKRT